MKKEKIELSIVIPCYCASNNIRSVIEEIDKTLKNRKIVYEVILVNDASPDDTYDVISRLTEERTNIVSIDLAKNSGQHAALMAGFQYAKGNIVATFEDDGQSEAELLTVMLDKMEEGYDIVTPHYIKRVQPSLFRRFGSKCERFMEDWLIEKPNGVYVSIYFMARKFVIEELCKYDQPYPYISGLILRSTSHIASVEGGVQKGRIGGNSGYNLKKLFSLWVNGFTAFSIKPLRISIVIGALFAVLGIIGCIVVVIKKIYGYGVMLGWSSVIAIMLFMFGIVLIVLGMIGEYVGRSYMCINKTPQYLIRKVVRSEEEEA